MIKIFGLRFIFYRDPGWNFMYSKSILDEIRDRVSIVSLIGERIPLKKAGRNFKGLCPFHGEKTPSFNVSDDKQIYHCFGCGEGGDIFSFVMKFDGVDFLEAVKYLAGLAGVELPKTKYGFVSAADEEHSKRKKWAFRINEIARDFFAATLKASVGGSAASNYLIKRGISENIWTQHFLGYADNAWESLVEHLRSKGVPLDLASELGLIRKRDSGGYFDFFRERIIFPIISPRGEVLGFGGRNISEQKGDQQVAKYMNSPDSLIYHKSGCVYGLNKAQSSIREDGSAIFVEGYMDLIALSQVGVNNVVAPLGTSLTEGHLRLIQRYTRNIVLVFDGDEAGSRAAIRSLDLFIDAGLMPRVVALPDDEDPDTFVRKYGAEKFREMTASAKSLFEFFVEKVLSETGRDAAGKVNAMGRIIPHLKAMSDPVERGIYSKVAAFQVGVEERDVARSVAAGKISVGREFLPRGAKKKMSAPASCELMLIKGLLMKPARIADVMESVSVEKFSDGWCRDIVSVLFSQTGEKDISVGDILASIDDPEISSQLREMAVAGCGCEEDEIDNLIDDCVNRLKERPAARRLKEINDEIKRAESARDEVKIFELLREKKELISQKHD